MRPKIRKYFHLVFLILLLAIGCESSSESSSESFVYSEEGIAVAGYDLVAFVMDNEAMMGKAENKIRYKEVDFYFTRPSYRDEFLQHPDQYLPAYGGWCAYEVALNSKRVASDPTLWIIQDGQLLFFSKGTDEIDRNKAEWVVKRRQLKEQADANWKGMN